MSEEPVASASIWRYAIEDCDIPECRRGQLRAYRELRDRCLNCLHRSDVSIATQLVSLGWYTNCYRTLNEASQGQGDNILWQLAGAGF